MTRGRIYSAFFAAPRAILIWSACWCACGP
jgi:hypothetical protein